MVLKKSNSQFNSGNTQRLCDRGALKQSAGSDISKCILTVTLEGSLSPLDIDKPSIEHVQALNKIYEYLGFPRPGLESFYLSPRVLCLDEEGINHSISLNKNHFWLLPEKIEGLMKEDTFLEGEEGIAEIQIHKIIRFANNNRVYRKRSSILKPKPTSNILEPKPKIENKDDKRKLKQHSRGVQRQRLSQLKLTNPPIKNECGDTLKKVIVELEEQHVDTRTVNGPENDSGRNIKYKSLFKSKGCRFGKNSEMKGFSYLQIKHDREFMETDFMNTMTYWSVDNDYGDDRRDEQEEYDYGDRWRNQGWDISIKSNQPKTKRQKGRSKNMIYNPTPKGQTGIVKERQKNKSDVIEEERVNSASSQLTLRHAKGSFQFIDKPCHEVIHSHDDHAHVTRVELKEIVDQTQTDSNSVLTDIQGHGINEIDLILNKTQSNLETFDSHDTFVRVNLQLDDDIQDMLMASRQLGFQPNPVSVKECPLSFGNCFPPVFCVTLQTENSVLDKGWNLIGASNSDSQSDKDLTWKVTLKNNQTSDLDGVVKDQFLSCLALQSNSHLSLESLVEMALASVLYSANKGNDNSKFENIHENRNNNVFSLDGALKKLDVIEKGSKVSHEENLTTTLENLSQVEIPDVSFDCDDVSFDCDICLTTCDRYGHNDSGIIVLLPCRHSFCYGCWQTHLFYSIAKGDHQFKCMHTNCNQLLNEATMNALVPETYMKRLYLQQRERRVDRSPLCQWCPKKQCNKIAVIDDWSSYLQQFGCSISCDCCSSWCFTCHYETHWPASCGQLDAYSKLLCKVDDTLPVSDVTFIVEVKPCPRCKYPIEKDRGCPHMVCILCKLSFCWKCLRSTDSHNITHCRSDESENFITFELHNEFINNNPLIFFDDSRNMREKYISWKKDELEELRAWLRGLHCCHHKFINLPFYRSCQLENVELSRAKAIILAEDTVDFLMETYNFMEYFYLLLSFAFLNDNKENNESYLRSVQQMCNLLAFVTTRLEQQILRKHVRKIVKVQHECQKFLFDGTKALGTLKRNVKKLQAVSQDVPTKWVGDLDLKKYHRYK